MTITYSAKQAQEQVEKYQRQSGKNWYNVKAKNCGNPVLTKLNGLIEHYRETIKKQAPHCKNKFTNSIGNAASSQNTSRGEYPLTYRFMLDVFQVESVKLLRFNDYNNVCIAMEFMIKNIAKCWWPTAFYDKKISENKDVLVQEWMRNVEINPYFELVAEARALVGR